MLIVQTVYNIFIILISISFSENILYLFISRYQKYAFINFLMILY